MLENDLLLAMTDDAFQEILQNDEELDRLEKEKNNPVDQYFEMMMICSKIFKISGVTVSCITPGIWAFLFSTGNAYAVSGKPITDIDTDIFIYLLSKGLKNVNKDYLQQAIGFCKLKGLDYAETQADLKTMIYLSFRPLEMLSMYSGGKDEQRFNADWLTRVVSVVCPLTNKTSEDVIFNTSLTQCFYYFIQNARKYDTQGLIKRRNSDQINQAIYLRTMELGKEYYQKNYKDK